MYIDFTLLDYSMSTIVVRRPRVPMGKVHDNESIQQLKGKEHDAWCHKN